MRLLHTTSLDLQVFMPEQVPDYVILSHRWCNQEVLYDDFLLGPLSSPEHPAQTKMGFEKMVGACKLARSDGYEWIWIDSCCMDKSSSAELQEAINSMWMFYSNANICYVYMVDVPDKIAGWDGTFVKSSWFDRGWTLQELIAPSSVEFYAADWSPIGTKAQRQEEIVARTYISTDSLLNPTRLDLKSTALKLSWAAHREVTREEDQAYSLLGLFQVNMPMLYGEGREKAYGRLQEAIYSATRDDSLFLFRYSRFPHDRYPLISDSPDRFCQREGCYKCQQECLQCLPPTLKYESIRSTDMWARQPHEQLFTTITAERFEASTTLMLLPAHKIYGELMDPKNSLDVVKRLATHVAVLNHTCMPNRETAICMLLRRNRPNEGVSTRVAAYPVMIRDVNKLISKLEERKVLFAFYMSSGFAKPISRLDYPVEMILQVEAESSLSMSWSVHDVDKELPTMRIIGENCLTVQANDWTRLPKRVTCKLAGAYDLGVPVTLFLQRSGQAWFITDADDPLERQTHGIWGKDRRIIGSASHKELTVSIRRVPAVQRPLSVDERARKIFKIAIHPHDNNLKKPKLVGQSDEKVGVA